MVRYSTAWHGMVWDYEVRYGMAWYGIAYGMARIGGTMYGIWGGVCCEGGYVESEGVLYRVLEPAGEGVWQID